MTYFNGDSEPHSEIQPQSWVERNGFAEWAVAVLWLVAAFILFQVLAGIVAVGLIAITEGLPSAAEAQSVMMERLDLVFIGNSAGQILFLGLATLLIVKLHVSNNNRSGYLRFNLQNDTGLFVTLSAVLFIVIQPAIWYLGYLNSLIPMPDSFSELQQSQYEMIENFLRSDGAMMLALFHIGLVPAVCEEVLFRGYVMRAFEKSWGIWTAIIVSGLMFGLYHMQLANLLPLATLGILLALVTWLSNSILPAIFAHFVNNGGAVVLATFFPDVVFADISPETAPPVWMLILSLLLSGGIIKFLYDRSTSKTR
ncbi:MAG TPA: type II CAAX endopeptidase family protein [Balneolaceae bacterium]|nr:type II CAAX endopeptidase family protein [Balneolaceae bacterium]